MLGDEPIRLERNRGTAIIWNNTSGNVKCIGFRCQYASCKNRDVLYYSRSSYNDHCRVMHQREHKKQKGPLTFTVSYADGDIDMMEQCGSCPKFFPIGCIRHYQKECLNKQQVFETETFALFVEHNMLKEIGDRRFKTPKTFFQTMFGTGGYYMFCRIVRDGVYDPDIKKAFVINKNVYECRGSGGRYYIIGSKSLGLCYIGSCFSKILSRFKEHILKVSNGKVIFAAEDCICASLGHLFGVNSKFKETKETLEFAIANNLEGVNGISFTNVIRK